MAFEYSYDTYDSDGTVDQGTLASTYTNALSAYLQSAEGADVVAFLAYVANGGDVDAALALKAQVEAGNFTLSNLFAAAQSKTGEVDGGAIGDPDPNLTVTFGDGTSVTVNLTDMLTGVNTETWQTIVKNSTIYHTREFFSESQEPEGYAADWADQQIEVQNEAPTATPLTWAVTEYDEHAAANASPAYEQIDLLSTANDPESDSLSVVAGSVKIDNGDGTYGDLPAYLSVDGSGNLIIDTNSADFDALHLDDALNLDIVYDITDGTNTISNSVDLTVTGTADQFHYSYSTPATASETLVASGVDPNLSALPDGDVSVSLSGVDADAFDFSGTVTVSVSGDINKINGDTYDQEWLLVNAEGGDQANLGPVQFESASNKEGTAFYTTDTDLMSFASSDNQVLVTYDGTNEVAGGAITATISEFDYWM